jgi:hypothetical protein
VRPAVSGISLAWATLKGSHYEKITQTVSVGSPDPTESTARSGDLAGTNKTIIASPFGRSNPFTVWRLLRRPLGELLAMTTKKRRFKMKSVKILLMCLVVALVITSIAYADVPKMINYQGKITRPSGALVDTTTSMVFTIYADSTGGTALWTETQTSVDVQYGVFSVLLGSVNPIPDSVFNGNVRYLGVKVGNDSDMTPRKAIVSVGYAYHSGTADTAYFAMPVMCWRHSGTQVFSGTITSTWSDLDLSSYVGVNYAIVMLKIKLISGCPEIKFRTNGDTEDVGVDGSTYYGPGVSGATSGIDRICYIIIETDSNGIVEWRSLADSFCILTLTGYVK